MYVRYYSNIVIHNIQADHRRYAVDRRLSEANATDAVPHVNGNKKA